MRVVLFTKTFYICGEHLIKNNIMKKIFTTLALAAMVILSACGGGGKDTVNKDGLQGRYQLDLSSMLNEAKAAYEAYGGEGDMASGIASMLLSNLDVTVQFESETAIVDASGAVMQMIKSMANTDVSLPMALGYKIENDSVLYLKQEGKDFEEAGVLKKIGDSYDYLKLIVTKDGKRSEIGLKKIK